MQINPFPNPNTIQFHVDQNKQHAYKLADIMRKVILV